MKYVSKKDPTIEAAFDFEDEKCKTTRLIYLTGKDAGKSFTVSNSTLKRYWKLANPLNIDAETVNTPYKPDVTPHYIPKPQSVIEYEENKKVKYNVDLPNFDVIAETFGSNLKKINSNSKYIMFNNKTTLWRKSKSIDVYACEEVWINLTEAGFQSKANKDKDRPYAIKILTADEYNKLVEVLNG